MYNKLNTKLCNLEKKNSWCNYLIQINQYNTDKENLEKKIEDVHKKYQTLVD